MGFLLGPDIAPELPLVAKFKAEEAIQGVAVDRDFFYAIDNDAIGKYERNTGRKVGVFRSTPQVPLIHMDGGMAMGGKLYCSHSNFPDTPMVSSVEIFDARTLRHIGTQSFGLDAGSLVWVDWHDDSWWVCFGHYNGKGGEPGKPNTMTSLVRYDRDWRKRGGYSFPGDVVARWDGMTASGGIWGPDNVLYVTSHHAPEFYLFRLPRSGSVLELQRIVKSPAEGQGLAIDPAHRRLFQIQRKERAVYEFDLAPLLKR
ncbi:MAG: hypothetical protein H7145_17145 [Akkermansiaceae bacterium]|nr:hypothetical protein [Armatimonadota bacterium]